MIEQIVFLVVLVTAVVLVTIRARRILGTLRLGKNNVLNDRKAERRRNVLLVAFGQKKMFKRPVPAILHLFVYVGFLIVNIEVLEFMVDGLAGSHRIFAPFLGSFYTVLMNIFEFLAVAVLLACVVFLIRRNILRLHRFWTPEMKQWPRLDANVILITEILLMLAILTMNASDQILQTTQPHYTDTGKLFFSSLLVPLFDSLSVPTLATIERFAWWFHIIGILGFAVYITYSKHLHIFLAFPNTYFARLEQKGHMTNMPVVTNEVRTMLGLADTNGAPPTEPGRFGAKDVNDLNWNLLLAAYSCTECGRCTSECPAHITGKKLSPRKIIMDTRDRLEEVGASIAKGGPGLADGKSLLDHYITREEINACTSCNACVEACPVLISPLETIMELRRYVAMEESGSPAAWNAMFQNVETNFAPWKFAPSDRFNWANNM